MYKPSPRQKCGDSTTLLHYFLSFHPIPNTHLPSDLLESSTHAHTCYVSSAGEWLLNCSRQFTPQHVFHTFCVCVCVCFVSGTKRTHRRDRRRTSTCFYTSFAANRIFLFVPPRETQGNHQFACFHTLTICLSRTRLLYKPSNK